MSKGKVPADITNNISNDGGKAELPSSNDHFCNGATARRRRETVAKFGRQWGGPNSPGLHIPLASLIQAVAVAEHLNFRHAASALGITQSSVSARVKALEEDLGILLFERHTRGVRLTEAGRHFVERVATGIHHLDFAIRTAGMVARGEWGSLRIGVHALIPGSFLADLLENFRQQNPGIRIEISESTARASIMQLRADQLDVAFVAGAPELPDYHSRRIWSERLMAALPSCHPL